MFALNLDTGILQNYEIKMKFFKMINNAKAYKLLYRGSKNGFLPKDFKFYCENKGHTITLCKVRGKNTEINNIIGGFTDIPWENYQYEDVSGFGQGNSFLFKIDENQEFKKFLHK